MKKLLALSVVCGLALVGCQGSTSSSPPKATGGTAPKAGSNAVTAIEPEPPKTKMEDKKDEKKVEDKKDDKGKGG